MEMIIVVFRNSGRIFLDSKIPRTGGGTFGTFGRGDILRIGLLKRFRSGAFRVLVGGGGGAGDGDGLRMPWSTSYPWGDGGDM